MSQEVVVEVGVHPLQSTMYRGPKCGVMQYDCKTVIDYQSLLFASGAMTSVVSIRFFKVVVNRSIAMAHPRLLPAPGLSPDISEETLRYPKPLVIGCGLVFFQQADPVVR